MFGFRLVRSIALVTAAALLSACGGGHGGNPIPTLSGPGTQSDPVHSATATFSFSYRKSASSRKRSPLYVSSATRSVTVQVTDTKNAGSFADIFANVPAALKSVQTANFANTTGNPNTAGQCGTDPNNTGNIKCTAVFTLPVGINSLTITAWDTTGGTGNKLSQQISTVTTVQGVANAYAISLDANASTMSVSATAACASGAVGATFGSVGVTPATFTVAFTDAAGKAITAPGLPVIEIKDNTGTYQTTSGTINGTGGTVAFTINQSAQTFSLTPSNSSVTNATVNLASAPANGGDGLSFSQTKTFTFSTGSAPPSSFLSVIEQSGSTGKIDFYVLSLGATDVFSPYSVNSLANTNSTNEGKPDVDNPRAMVFDANGNLLIANGGQGGTGGDYGDFACVPAGAISSGASTATTNSQSAYDPQSIAIGTDNSVAIGNVPAGAAYNFVEYLLGTTYTLAPAARLISNSGGLGTNDVVSLPTAPQAGTFAAAITNATTVSRVAIKSSNGTETDLVDSTIYDPVGLAWDNANAQIVISSAINTTGQSYLDFYTVGGSKVKSVIIRDDGTGNSLLEGDKVAASPSGYVAVAGAGWTGLPEVQVYDGTASRNTVGGPIPYDACVDSACSTYVYGTNPVVTSLHFLSNTKLLVTLSDSSSPTQQGVYIYDVSQLAQPCTCYDQFTGLQQANSPKQTGFLQFASNPPLAAAYKP